MSEMYEYDDEDISDLMDIVELQTENDKLNKEIKRLKIIEEKYKDSQLYIKDFKDEIERLTLSYEDALEDLDKKESIIKEVKKWKEKLNNKKIIDLNWELEYLDEILDKGE